MSEAEKQVEDLVRERAYLLWQEAGSPEGASDHFWEMARRQIEAGEEEEPSQAAPADVKSSPKR